MWEVSHFVAASGKPKDTGRRSDLMLVRTTGMWEVPQLTVKASDPGRRSNLTQNNLALEEDSRQSIQPKCQFSILQGLSIPLNIVNVH